jgi:hypothetical protein
MPDPTPANIRRGAIVRYRTPSDYSVRAVVKIVHRDGSFTVEPGLMVNRHGVSLPGWIGGRVRIGASDLLCMERGR